MDSRNQEISLSEAAGIFLAELPPEGRTPSQQEIYKFIRWFGWDRAFTELTATGVDDYTEQLSRSDTDYMKKLELVRAFLVYAKKKGWSKTNLSVHLKAKKGKTKITAPSRKGSVETVFLTRQGYTEMEAELAALKSKRLEVIEEIRRAAADKDFRENAPLQAAREERGQLEGRIMELQETIKSAVIIDKQEKSTLKVSVGDSVIICDLASGKELHYTLVSPSEVDPVRGRISSASPIGQAVIGRDEGEIVEVVAPAGKLRYQIKQIER